MKFRIGIDLGGTKIEGIVLDAQGGELFRQRVDTEREKGYAHILGRLKAVHDELAARISGAPHTFGIGTPGTVSPRTGLLKNSNTTCLNGQSFRQMLEQTLGRTLVIENDANCFALAEATLGAGKGYELVFGVILGTGCGGGIVIDGKIRKGPQSIAGEWGHMSIDPNRPLCYCGKKGCVETFISGGGLERQFQLLTKQTVSAEQILSLSLKGDPNAKSLIANWHRNTGRSLANVINVLDPSIIVMGGGLSNEPSLYKEGIEQVRYFVFNDELTTPIIKNSLGD